MEEKEQPVYEIGKVKMKSDNLTVEYAERYVDANYSNEVIKTCAQFVHSDLKYAFNLLRPHVAVICEMPEASRIDPANPTDEDINETLKGYVITGYSKGGSEESAGVSILAQKLLRTGQALNLSVPFTRFYDESGEGYTYGSELEAAVKRCDYEVDAYLFEEKWGLKQESFDFDEPEESTVAGTEEAPKKKGRGRKRKEAMKESAEEAQAFDHFA
jgi:hypothetical protein